jgi:hypothetical protein
MTDEEAIVIVQLARDGAVDRNLRDDPPPSVLSGRVVLDHVAPGADGRLGPPEGGEVVLSILSPEALREPDQVREAVSQAADDEPPVIIIEAGEYLREDELAVAVDAAARSRRTVILRVVSDA